MRQPPDPYRELGVPRGASEEQIKAAHRRLAKRYHPDASSGERERFLAIQEAYLVLTDPIRRREWDARHAPGPVRASPGPTHGAPMARSRRGTQPRPDVTGTTARTSRGTTRGSSASGRTTAAPREPGTQAYTWSAAGVPWWEDFQPKGGAGPAANGSAPPSEPPWPGGARSGPPGGSRPTPPGGARSGPSDGEGSGPPGGSRPTPPGGRPGPEAPHHEPDPYARSSGTAWSSAARRYFRQGDADLPRGGQFRYRGTQLVTGTEARRVADEELRRRRSQAAAQGPPAHGTASARPAPAASGFVARLRRLLGG